MGGILYGVHLYFSIALIIYYVLYVRSVYKSRKDNESDLDKNNVITKEISEGIFMDFLNLRLFRFFSNGKVNSITSIVVIILSVLLIGFSCDMLITSTEYISRRVGINLFFVSFLLPQLLQVYLILSYR